MTPQAENRLWWAKFWIVLAAVCTACLFAMIDDYRYAHRSRFTGDGASIARRTAWALQNAYLWESGHRQGLEEGRLEGALLRDSVLWQKAYAAGIEGGREMCCDGTTICCNLLTTGQMDDCLPAWEKKRTEARER